MLISDRAEEVNVGWSLPRPPPPSPPDFGTQELLFLYILYLFN